jgi:hypothetical protein
MNEVSTDARTPEEALTQFQASVNAMVHSEGISTVKREGVLNKLHLAKEKGSTSCSRKQG